MDPLQAIEVLTQVAAAAQKAGVLTLQEAVVVSQSIDSLNALKEEISMARELSAKSLAMSKESAEKEIGPALEAVK